MDSQAFHHLAPVTRPLYTGPSSLYNDDIPGNSCSIASVPTIVGARSKPSVATKNTNHYHDKLKERYIGIGPNDIEYRPFRKQVYTDYRNEDSYEIKTIQKKHFDIHLNSRNVKHNIFEAHAQ